MPYGTVKVDNVTFTNNSVDATTTFSGIYASITNNLTLSGTATAATFTGTTANFTNVNAQNISVTTSLSGLAITGGTAGFTTITGTTVTGTTANFVTVSGTTVTGTTAQFITITGGTAGFTTITGTTVTGTTANFVTVSGTTVTGTTASFTSGVFTSLSGTTHTITSGVFASGTAALPSISFVSDPNTGIYSPGADQVAVATNGTGRLFVDGNGQVSVVSAATTTTNLTVNGTTSFSASANWNFPGLLLRRTASNIATAKQISFLLDGDTESDTTLTNYLNIWGTYSGPPTTSSTSTGLSASMNLGAPNAFIAHTNGSERLRITSTGALSFVGAGTAGSTQAVSFNGSAPINSLVIDSSGLVGIGTSSVNAKIQIEGSDAAPAASGNMNSGIVYQAGAGARAVNIGVDNTNNFAWINSAYTNNSGTGTNTGLRLMVGATSAIAIDSSQRVGIGPTSPEQALHVSQSGGNNFAGIRSQNSNSGTGTAGIEFSSDSTYAKSAIGLVRGDANGVGSLVFYNASSTGAANWSTSDERLRIDSSGRLLVGTSTTVDGDTSILQVAGGDAGRPRFHRNLNDQFESALRISKARGAANQILSSGDIIGTIDFQGADGASLRGAAQISAAVDGTPGANDMPGRLVFSTTADGASSPTERMRIGANANVKITQPNTNTDGLTIDNTNGSFASSAITITTTRAAGTDCLFFYGLANAAQAIIIYNNGNIVNANNSYGAISDLKLKENIVDSGSQWDDLKSLQVRKYNFKEGQTHTQIGLVAQEVELVSPGLVSESPDRDEEGNDLGTVTKSVNYSVLYMKAVKALQEAMERIEALEAKVTALEGA